MFHRNGSQDLPPLQRDKRGWRVAPAPDGRGLPDEQRPQPPHRWRGFWLVVIALLAINFVSSLALRPIGPPRVQIPFSPFFLEQVKGDNVVSISSTGDTIDGTFGLKTRYPALDPQAVPTTLFTTEVP